MQEGYKKVRYNMNYFLKRIHDLTNVLVLGEMNVSISKEGDGHLNGAS